MSNKLTEDRKPSKELHWLERTYYSFQPMLAVVGILALFIYFRQLGTMQDSLTEMRASGSQTDKLLSQNESQLAQITKQAQETQKLAEQARLQAEATQHAISISKRQADITELAAKNTEADKRPWVAVVPEDLPALPQSGNATNYSTSLRLENYGDTPARNVRIACEAFLAGTAIETRLRNYVKNNLHPSKHPPAGIPPSSLKDFVMQTPLAPSQQQEVTQPWPTDHYPIGANYLDKIKQSNAAYYFQCELLYDGSYGVHGETDSLWFVGDQFGAWSLIASEIGNDIH